MYRCLICKTDVPLDDCDGYNQVTGMCLCLRCFLVQSDTYAPMPARLRRQLVAITTEG